MRTLCIILCGITFLGGIAEVVTSTSPEKEIVATLTLLIAVVFFVGAGVIDAISQSRKEIIDHLKR